MPLSTTGPLHPPDRVECRRPLSRAYTVCATIVQSTIAYLSLTTLRRTRSEPRGARTAMCVQNANDQCVLQFTLLLAAGCVLHRRTSRAIHHRELYLVFFRGLRFISYMSWFINSVVFYRPKIRHKGTTAGAVSCRFVAAEGPEALSPKQPRASPTE